MLRASRAKLVLLAAVLVPAFTGTSYAQAGAEPINNLPNPFRTVRDWAHPPGGAPWAAVTAVEAAPDGSIYVIHRCAGNSCDGRKEPPILKFNKAGQLLMATSLSPRDTPAARREMIAFRSSPKTGSSSSPGARTEAVRANSIHLTRSLWIREDAYLSATAPIIASRSSTRMAATSTPGASSRGQAGSSSPRTTRCMSPTRSRGGLTSPAGKKVSASAAPKTARSNTLSKIWNRPPSTTAEPKA